MLFRDEIFFTNISGTHFNQFAGALLIKTSQPMPLDAI